LVEGIFYAKLICNDATQQDYEIDARTSDAIALAVRFNCPIYTYEFILSSAGIILEDETLPEAKEGELAEEVAQKVSGRDDNEYHSKSTEELKTLLQTALEDEQYELASKIRDELNQRKQS